MAADEDDGCRLFGWVDVAVRDEVEAAAMELLALGLVGSTSGGADSTACSMAFEVVSGEASSPDEMVAEADNSCGATTSGGGGAEMLWAPDIDVDIEVGMGIGMADINSGAATADADDDGMAVGVAVVAAAVVLW